jgi:hypothetical protein
VTKTSKITIGLLLTEAVFTGYFFYAQPLCEPCLPNVPCPPCISEQQVITFWIGIIIAIISVIYLAFITYQSAK